MTTTADIDLEPGDLSEWDFGNTDGGDLSVTTGAALHGTYGMQILIDDTVYCHQAKALTKQAAGFRCRIYFDLNSVTMLTTNDFIFSYFQNASTFADLIDLHLNDLLGQKRIVVNCNNDAGGASLTTTSNVTDAPHCIEIKAVRAATSVSSDGSYEIFIDGVSVGSVTGVDNFNLFDDGDWYFYFCTRLLDAGTSGTIFLDDAVITDTPNTAIGCIATPSLGYNDRQIRFQPLLVR